MDRFRPQYFDVPPKSSLETLEDFGDNFAAMHRGIRWWIGDLARYAEARFPDTWNQVLPEWFSPDEVERCKAVAKAYPDERDRNPLASWTIHMRLASYPDRVARVQAHVDEGRTSDEARKADASQWLLAVDVNYYLFRQYKAGAGLEAADGVASWVERKVKRLQQKGLTHAVCCFDSLKNHRKELTYDWEHRYKDRPPKPQEFIQQIRQVWDLLNERGLPCVSLEGMEADDVMASFAAQFPGKVTLLTQDKDLRQCLSSTCNILLDVEWESHPISGDMSPGYIWVTSESHLEETGIEPGKWVQFQAIAGDAVDNIKGARGIGPKGAADLVKTFGSARAAIDAAKLKDRRITLKQQEALVEFEEKLEITLLLVTMRTDLRIPMLAKLGG